MTHLHHRAGGARAAPEPLPAADDRTFLPFGTLEEAAFLNRPNRYLAWVERAGEAIKAHVPDPGRMRELLLPGRRVYVRDAGDAPNRSTRYDLVLVEYQAAAGDETPVLVSVDAQLPNRLVKMALHARRWDEFAGYDEVRAEVREGASRFDFVLTRGRERCIVEVKSVGMMRDGVGWFPDAVTARGRRHVEELAALRRTGTRAAVVFVAQRSDVRAIRPAPDIDLEFARALSTAVADGVETYGWRTAVSLAGIELESRVPVEV